MYIHMWTHKISQLTISLCFLSHKLSSLSKLFSMFGVQIRGDIHISRNMRIHSMHIPMFLLRGFSGLLHILHTRNILVRKRMSFPVSSSHFPKRLWVNLWAQSHNFVLPSIIDSISTDYHCGCFQYILGMQIG